MQNDDAHDTPTEPRRTVSRRDVRPSPKETWDEMKRFSVGSWGPLIGLTGWTLVTLFLMSVLLLLIDALVYPMTKFTGSVSMIVVPAVLSVLVIGLFLRTDPPGGTGGLVGDGTVTTWSRRRPGWLHWSFVLALVFAGLLLH